MPSEKKSMWQREMEWLLSVSEHIVELIPSWQTFPDGNRLEVILVRFLDMLAVKLFYKFQLHVYFIIIILDGCILSFCLKFPELNCFSDLEPSSFFAVDHIFDTVVESFFFCLQLLWESYFVLAHVCVALKHKFICN